MKAIDFPFRLAPGGAIAMTPDYNHVVRAQVIDALMTNLGERVFRPRYGCDFQSALFDPTDELVRRDAASLISTRLQQLVTRCIVRSVDVAEGNPGTVVITVVYRCSLYATDTSVAVPVASEFINRQHIIQSQIAPPTPAISQGDGSA
jgi:phage baseplate assembly protein W